MVKNVACCNASCTDASLFNIQTAERGHALWDGGLKPFGKVYFANLLVRHSVATQGLAQSIFVYIDRSLVANERPHYLGFCFSDHIISNISSYEVAHYLVVHCKGFLFLALIPRLRQ